jgi:predicted outer membrane lipoprotein
MDILISFAMQYWQWLLGGMLACILGAVQVRLFWHQTKETRLKTIELQRRLNDVAEAASLDMVVHSTFHGFSYREYLEGARELTIVLNDGRSLIDSNREYIKNRLSVQGKVTRFCFVSPISDYLGLLIAKNGKTRAAQCEEIHRSLNVIIESAPPWADVKVFAHCRATPYAILLTEDVAIVHPYYFFEAGSLPMFIFRKDNELYESYRTDVHRLLSEADLLTESMFSEFHPKEDK